jgi:Fuc2NAc and GlcNAc transferase
MIADIIDEGAAVSQSAAFKGAAIVLVTLLATALVRRYALARNVVDIPNDRSSHIRPTPRGGGVAVLACYLVSFALWTDGIKTTAGMMFIAAGLSVGVIGFMDDHAGIRARWRFLVHIGSAGLCVWGLSTQRMTLPHPAAEAALWGFAVLFLAWMINLYNFMDGIDGIAGVEAITVGIGGLVLHGATDQRWEQGLEPLFLAAAALGFLFWNFPAARIFLGDAGSGFIGLMLGVFALQAGLVEPRLFFAWSILLGCFIVDATFTLGRRVLAGKSFYRAHRDHAYQHAAIMHGSHVWVTLGVGLINLFWLLPVAVLVAQARLGVATGVTLAYLPLLLVALRYRAGVNIEEPQG